MFKYINKHKNQFTLLSGILIVVGFIISLTSNKYLKDILLMTATIISGIPIAIKAFQAIRMKAFSIELLVTIAVAGALFLGEYTESSVVGFLFLFGDYLEARTLEKTRSSLKSLIDMAPQEATVIREGQTMAIPVEEVVKGDRVVIKAGGKVPVDGSIISGKALLNESAVTGEPVPVLKTVKDRVFSGTIVDNGYIEIIAEKVGNDTTFARIIELVEEAQESKTKTEKFLDKFASVYTPAIIVLSVLVYVLTGNLHIAITFLVVACPGALVIGAPVSNVAGIGNGARNGVLIKGGEVMDRLSRVTAVVFDKTGTLTKGKPEVTDIKIFNNMNSIKINSDKISGNAPCKNAQGKNVLDQNELLRLVAEVEKISEHHLGYTIVKEAEARNLNLKGSVSEAEVVKGSGIRGKVEDHVVTVGNRKMMNAENIFIPDEVSSYATEREKEGNTAVFAAIDGKITGIISIADQIREDARKAVSNLRENGVKRIIMLTGDNRHAAELVAKQLGLDEFHAELLPGDKVEFIKKLKEEGHVVAMAGDGINDAPAIATADIGLAMGEGGTDISMETADVVLMADKLMQFSHAYALSKATMRNMRQNTFFAVAVVIVLLAGVLTENVHLASGMFIHEASVLAVILNAMRLIGFNSRAGKGRNTFA